MRLLTWKSPNQVCLTKPYLDDVPPYAILSHTWSTVDGDEVLYEDVIEGKEKSKPGYAKIDFCGQQAKKDGIDYFWVDTCCIKKPDLTELSEAITSMFRWYQNSEKCYVYLSDVSSVMLDFSTSRWFTRGWTLQELLAPKVVEFFSKEGDYLGSKETLREQIHARTTIPLSAFQGSPLQDFPVSERLRWAESRSTTRKEDRAYCLLGIFNVYMPPIYGEGDNAFVRLNEEIDKNLRPKCVDLLDVVEGAAFDAYGQIHQPCHPATRTNLLSDVKNWAQQDNGKFIFWLNGMAGTGKSTISFTIAEWLAKQTTTKVALAGSFFFKRGERDRSSASLLFPTIAAQLALKLKFYDAEICTAIFSDPKICRKSLAVQFDKLIRGPLQRLRTIPDNFKCVIVLDALDECDNPDDIQTILQLWSSLAHNDCSWLRLFLTSRPEFVIRIGFRKMSEETYQNIILHKLPKRVLKNDIQMYLADELSKVKNEYNLDPLDDLLGENWPGPTVLDFLVDLAMPLFVVAATIRRFVADFDHPQEGLDTILGSGAKEISHRAGTVYMTVLQSMLSLTRRPQHVEKMYQTYQAVVGTVVLLAEPLSRKSLAALLQLRVSEIQSCLRPLHSVLQIPTEEDKPIRPLHLSFGEYLLSDDLQSTPFGVDAKLAHARLWRQCLQIMSGPEGLQENMCDLEYPGFPKTEIPREHIRKRLPSEMRYACRYWVHHLLSSGYQLLDGDEVHSFLKRHFLHWLEALSLTDRLADAIGFVTALKSTTTLDVAGATVAFLEDAYRFILTHRESADGTPLQLYSSAIVFAPHESLVRSICGHVPEWITREPFTRKSWGRKLQVLEVLSSHIAGVSYSSDGSQIGVIYGHGGAQMWNAWTGQEIQVLNIAAPTTLGHLFHSVEDDVLSFLSPDHVHLASAQDQCIDIWHVKTGQITRRLVHGRNEKIKPLAYSLAYSRDGSLLACAGGDSLQLWEPVNGRLLWTASSLEGFNPLISRLTFSPSGSSLAWRNWGTLEIFDTQTGNRSCAFSTTYLKTIGIGAICDQAYSLDGLSIITIDDQERGYVWGIKTGTLLRKLDVPSTSMTALSLDGTKIALECGLSVRIWGTETDAELFRLDPSRFAGRTAFSPDSLRLVTAGQVVEIWDLQEAESSDDFRRASRIIGFASAFDGLQITYGLDDGSIHSHNVETGLEYEHSPSRNRKFSRIVFSKDATLAAAVTQSGDLDWWPATLYEIHVWCLTSVNSLLKLTTINHKEYGFAFTHDDSKFVFADGLIGNQNIEIFDLKTGKSLQILSVDEKYYQSSFEILISPDDRLFAIYGGLSGCPVSLFEATDGVFVASKMVLGFSGCTAVAISSDSAKVAILTVAYFGAPSSVQIFNTKTGQILSTLPTDLITAERNAELRFIGNSESLSTQLGTYHFEHNGSPKQYRFEPIDRLSIKDNWIRFGNKNILKVPHEYKLEKAKFFGNILAIPHDSGALAVIEIDPSKGWFSKKSKAAEATKSVQQLCIEDS